jgi:hypothetical protein
MKKVKVISGFFVTITCALIRNQIKAGSFTETRKMILMK